MPHEPFDPLHCIPSPHVVRGELAKARRLANRLAILLKVSERIHAAAPSAAPPPTAERKAVAGAC